jgi:hypothetical protein
MSTLALQTAVVTSVRVGLFLGCRNYLLRTVYHDLLRDSSNGDPEESEVELDPLPQPSSARISQKTEFHSILARSLFSICLEESCVLFALLMCQGFGILEPRCVHYRACGYVA